MSVRIAIDASRKMRGVIAKAMGLAMLNQGLGLLDPLIFRLIIDRVLLRQDGGLPHFLREVGGFLLAAVGIAFVSRLAKNAQDHYFTLIARRIGAEIYVTGVQAILQWPFNAFERTYTAEATGLLQRVRAEVESFTTTALAFAAAAVIGITFVTVYSFTVHFVIGWLFLLTSLATGSLSVMMSGRVHALQQRILREGAQIDANAVEALRNIEFVKSLGLETQQAGSVAEATARVLELEIEKSRYLRRATFVQGTVTNLVRMGIMTVMLYLVHEGVVTLGQFFSLFIYAFVVFVPLQELGNVIGRFQETRASLGALAGVLDGGAAYPDAREKIDPGAIREVACTDVTFAYGREGPSALRGVTVYARRGETIAIVGGSGAGKTTLLKLLLCLYRPEGGTMSFNGIAVAQIDLTALRRRLSVVTQEPQLFGGSMRSNLLLAKPDATDEECWTALTEASCDHLASRSRWGLDADIGESGGLLSRGERQRLALARALIRRPSLLVLDEATASLDSAAEAAVHAVLRRFRSRGDAITVIVTHRLSTVRDATRVYVLEAGQVTECGTHDELIARRGAYWHMWRQQEMPDRGMDESLRGGLYGEL